MLRKAAVVIALGVVMLPAICLAATAFKGLDFKAPDEWSAQQHELAGKAIVLLMDECPAIKTYLSDIESAKVEKIDMSLPINRQVMAATMPYPWNPVLLVSLNTSRTPKSKLLIAARDARGNLFAGNGGVADFYLVASGKPGIFIQTSLFPESLCGAKHPVAVRTQDRSAFESSAPDTFVSVPAMKILDQF